MGARRPRFKHGWIALRAYTPTQQLPQCFGILIAYSQAEHLRPFGRFQTGRAADASR